MTLFATTFDEVGTANLDGAEFMKSPERLPLNSHKLHAVEVIMSRVHQSNRTASILPT